MSQQVIQIPSLLKPEEIIVIESLLKEASFVDGKITASMAAKAVKNNLQVDAKSNDIAAKVQQVVSKALQESPFFQATAFPQQVYPCLVSKYDPGRHYGWHVDSPVMGDPAMRTDLAMTIFLSEPASYQGGELLLQTTAGISSYKPSKGDAVLYPCQYLHCVNEVSQGERLAVVTWIQSRIRSAEQRQVLFDLGQVHALLNERNMHAPETILLMQAYSNLFRIWAEF